MLAGKNEVDAMTAGEILVDREMMSIFIDECRSALVGYLAQAIDIGPIDGPVRFEVEFSDINHTVAHGCCLPTIESWSPGPSIASLPVVANENSKSLPAFETGSLNST